MKALDGDATGGQEKDGNDRSSDRHAGRRIANQNGKYRAVTGGQTEDEEKKSKMASRKPSSSILKISEEGYRFTPYKKTFNPPKVEPVYEEKKDEGFGFGNFLKWLIIAGIVIVAFILFGGQILNYSNSGD